MTAVKVRGVNLITENDIFGILVRESYKNINFKAMNKVSTVKMTVSI